MNQVLSELHPVLKFLIILGTIFFFAIPFFIGDIAKALHKTDKKEYDSNEENKQK